MKHIFLACLFSLSLSLPAVAADITVSPYPAHGVEATPQEWLDTVADLKSLNAKSILITKTWHDMEVQRGIYSQIDQLGKDFKTNAGEGREVFFGFQPINTVKRDMPADLMKMAWDDPKLIQRFQELLDQMSLDITTPPKFISLANEADVYFEKHPKELEPFLKFYEAAQVALKRNNFPGARVGVTVTYEGLVKGRGAVIQKLVDASDIAIFTYYPIIDLKPQPIENVGESLDAILKVAGEKDVFLQEVGYPSGAGLGSSEGAQAFFFKTVLGAIQQRDQIKFANIFLLHDFGPKLCDDLIGYYGFEKAPGEVKAKFRDFLCTLGLKTFDGKEKPAWKAVKEALK